MIKNETTNVLLIYEDFIPSVCLCGYEPMKYLEQEGKINFQHGCNYEITSKQCEWADVVIFVRSSTWLEWKIGRKCQNLGKFVIYILDDDLFEIAWDSLSAGYHNQKTVRTRMRWFIDHSDVFVSPSRHLLEKYGQNTKKAVQIEEPCLNQKFTDFKKIQNEKVRIGFAGSADRKGDVQQILQDAIEQFYLKHKESVEIEFMGVKIPIIDKYGFTYYPYEEDYGQYQKKILERNWDIGLAPMPDTEFHRGKHYNKYIEYGSIGCIGIYSNVPPYTYIIENGKNGILCNNTADDWVNAMEQCLENPKMIEKIRNNVQLDMAQRFAIEVVTEQFVQKIPELLFYKTQTNRKIPVLSYRFFALLIRGLEFVQRNGIHTLKKLWEKQRNKYV